MEFFSGQPLGNEPFGLGMLSVNMCLSELSWIMWELVGLPVMLVMWPVQSACSTSQEFLSSGIRKVGLLWRSGGKCGQVCMCEWWSLVLCLFSIQWNSSRTSIIAAKLSRESRFKYFLLITSRGEFKVQSISVDYTGTQFSQSFWFPGIKKTWAHWRMCSKGPLWWLGHGSTSYKERLRELDFTCLKNMRLMRELFCLLPSTV